MESLDSKVAVVTGATRGIGLGLARCFGEHGMKIVCADLDPVGLDSAVAQLEGLGIETIGVVTDVADADALDALRDQTFTRFGTAHVVCNNAGIGGFERMTTGIDVESWRRTIDVNLFGVLHGVRSFLPRLLEQDDGHIVNTSSRQGLVGGLASIGAYSTSKFGVVGLSEVLDAELRELGANVGVSVLCAGPVMSGMAGGGGASDVDDDLAVQFARIARTVIDPVLVGPLVVEAIAQRRLFVNTHRETLELLEHRHQRILDDAAHLGAPGP